MKKGMIVLFSIFSVITLLILVNSIIFSVQHIDVYCYNVDEDELNAQVISSSNIKIGASILFINEKNIEDSINSKVANAKVINIERKFPNRLSINFVKLMPYLYFEHDSNYYICSNNGKILEVTKTVPTNLVKVNLFGELTSTTVGSSFSTTEPNDFVAVVGVLKALELLKFKDDVVELLDSINMDFADKKIVNIITKQGVTIVLSGLNKLGTQVHSAMSLFISLPPDKQASGRIIVFDSDPSNPTYSPKT